MFETWDGFLLGKGIDTGSKPAYSPTSVLSV